MSLQRHVSRKTRMSNPRKITRFQQHQEINQSLLIPRQRLQLPPLPVVQQLRFRRHGGVYPRCVASEECDFGRIARCDVEGF